jgi:hypothetical protein
MNDTKQNYEYLEYRLALGELFVGQPDELWPGNNIKKAYQITNTKRASKLKISEDERYGRYVISPLIDDVVKNGPKAEQKLDKIISRRIESLHKKGCNRIVRLTRCRAPYTNDKTDLFFEEYYLFGFVDETEENTNT